MRIHPPWTRTGDGRVRDILRSRVDFERPDQRNPEAIQWLAAAAGPLLERYFRPVVHGLHHIPDDPVLFVGNHNGGTVTPDSFIFGQHVLRRHGIERVPWGLTHDFVLRFPVVRRGFRAIGAVRANHGAAQRVFERGGNVLVYPGGELDAWRPFRDRNRIVFGGRRGYIKLALRSDVPIMPVVAAGAHATFYVVDDGRWLARLIGSEKWMRCAVWPITVCMPWGVIIGPTPPYLPFPTRIFIEVLEPIRFERSGAAAAEDQAYVAACDLRVRHAMQDALTRLAAERAQASRGRPFG